MTSPCKRSEGLGHTGKQTLASSLTLGHVLIAWNGGGTLSPLR